MLYLIDPQQMRNQRCNPRFCFTLCTTFCGIKPLYGVDPT